MVEVSGMMDGIEKSEAELKAGPHKGGGLNVEFEGPGHDVKASNAVVGPALGTSGRTEPEKNDIKTFLIKVKVDNVRHVATIRIKSRSAPVQIQLQASAHVLAGG
jgi:hypothetical protein